MGTIETVWKSYSSDERSVIADKGEIGFIDYEDDKSVCNYDPIAEGPIVISIPFPFVKGKPQSVFKGQTAVDCITIQNTTSEPIDLWKVKIYSSNPEDSYTLSLMEPPSANSDVEAVQGFLESFSLDDRVLQPRKTLKVWLSCKPQDIGIHTTAVHFDVGDDRIERVVFLLAEDQISQSIAPNKPYARVQRKNRYNVTDYVPGSRPAAKATTQVFKYRLPMYQLPKDKREMLERRELPEEIANGLNSENYGAFFSILLMMEELKLEEEMKSHDLECVPMTRKGHLFLALEVPGLAERRPSLVHGDFVFATPATENHDTRSYQGYIHRVEADEVFLKFSTDLHKCHCDGDLYNIRFTYNRVNMRRLYQAIQAAAQSLEIDFLFPSQSPIRRIIEAPIVTPLNPCLNEEQKLCVKMILGCKGGPPYVIHGPPGTGKTMTLVETILQLYTTRNNARILVCASSNSAADHILEKLIAMEVAQIKKKEIFRLNATSRPYEDVNPDHIQFCYFEDFIFRCPPTKALKRYKIIISTYMSSSLLYAEGIKRGHFSHVFLDEAGQASEPETMIPISNICSRQTVVVLAGDPMQLGPVIYSRDAESYGLGKSFLERLFECEFYHTEDANFVVKLVKNYRCHQAILELPSELFYKGELIACKEKSNSCSEAWENLLPNKEFPVLFVGIQGCDEREGNNPSWFNRIEVSKVVEIVKKLMSESDMLTETDIGVITPYRQQVLKMKKIFEDQLDMPNIKVGSVEQFQGQERRVIIISTVRSTVKHNQFDRTHYLGFLSNPRRYNVALTRAGSLLIIVGNPHIICKDPYWNKLLWYAVDNNSYQGCPMPEREDYPEEGVGEERNLNFEGHWHNQQPWQEPGLDHGSDGRQQSYQGGEWDSGKQSYQGGEWDSGQQSYQGGEWDCPEQSNQAGGEWDCPQQSNQAGGEWDCPQQSNQAGGEWECPQQSNQAGGEWECPQQSNHAGEWADPQQSKHAGWVDPQASKYAGWSREQKKHGDWDEPKHKTRGEWQGGNWQPTKWIEPERSNWGTNCFSDLPKPVTDEAEWSDGWK